MVRGLLLLDLLTPYWEPGRMRRPCEGDDRLRAMGLPRADGGCEMDAYDVRGGAPSIDSRGPARGDRCAPPYMSRDDMAGPARGPDSEAQQRGAPGSGLGPNIAFGATVRGDSIRPMAALPERPPAAAPLGCDAHGTHTHTTHTRPPNVVPLAFASGKRTPRAGLLGSSSAGSRRANGACTSETRRAELARIAA